MTNYFPKYFSNRAVLVYSVLVILTPLLFAYPMKLVFYVFGFVEVACFFILGSVLTQSWSKLNGKTMERKLFTYSFCVRIAFVIVSYFLYYFMTGSPYGFGAADELWYDSMGRLGADIILGANIKWSVFFNDVGLSDLGYPLWLSIIYALTGKSVILYRCIKSLIGAYTVVLIYRVSCRNFGDSVGRMAAVFSMLMPNLVFYCGLNLKEIEMLFLVVLFIEKADKLMHSSKASFPDLFVIFLSGISVYFFRAVLSALLFLSFGFALVLGNARIKRGGKWVFEGLILLFFIVVLLWNRSDALLGIGDYSSIQAEQEANIEWRAGRVGGNALATNASSAVYAPLIFTLPFPTMVNVENQESQQMINGGNFVKNVMSFLTVFALIILLMNGEWRDHMLPLAFMLGYLFVLIFSNYAHSERFHIPSLPFELMFAAYGVSQFKGKHKNWFIIWLVVVFFANIGWSWFKLRGRGM